MTAEAQKMQSKEFISSLMAKQVILRLEGVTKRFAETRMPAVADVTLTLLQGDLLGLLGPSGCGKTTLLRLIAGFERPDAGTVAIARKAVAGGNCWVPPEQRCLGMVFQDYALFPHLTVAENVAFGLHSGNRIKQRQNAARLIALVGLAGLENRYPHELSGGQQQRVALARALAPQPKLILLDEPLSNLDGQVRLRLREEVREILKATGTSGIFVTHDREEALSIADQVAVMRLGQIEQIGTPEQIYTEPASRFVAEFVTQANFLPAQRKGQLWETEVGCFAVKPQKSEGDIYATSYPYKAASYINRLGNVALGVHPAADTVDLMIREEDLILKPAEVDAPVVIRTRRFLGREYRYCLQTPSGKELHARTTLETDLPVGTRVHLAVAKPALRFFPANQGTNG